MNKPLLLTALLATVAGGIAIVSYDVRRPLHALPSDTETRELQDADGRMLYLKNCRTCHGATGMPSAENKTKYPKIKALNDSLFVAGLSDDSLMTVLKKGKGKDMKSWSDKLSSPEMAAVIKYVRTLGHAH